jgi:hypothetical protein
MGLRFSVEIAQLSTCLSLNRAVHRIDINRRHLGEIDDKTTITHRSPCNVVASASDRDKDARALDEFDGGNHISDPATAGDQGGVPIDHSVPDGSRLVISAITLPDEIALERVLKRNDRGL